MLQTTFFDRWTVVSRQWSLTKEDCLERWNSKLGNSRRIHFSFFPVPTVYSSYSYLFFVTWFFQPLRDNNKRYIDMSFQEYQNLNIILITSREICIFEITFNIVSLSLCMHGLVHTCPCHTGSGLKINKAINIDRWSDDIRERMEWEKTSQRDSFIVATTNNISLVQQ